MTKLTRKLAEAQELHAQDQTVIFRLYTEHRDNLVDLTRRYFDGATFYFGVGIYKGGIETARIIEIVGKLADLQNVVHLAGDIRELNSQSAVLVAWHKATSIVVAVSEGN